MTTTTWTHLLEGRPIASPFPLTPETTVALLDWLADLNHGPDGKGPENAGAAQVLHVLGYHLQHDDDASSLLSILRAAVAHEDEAERKAPCASTALAAARALDQLHQALEDQIDIESFYALLFHSLPTPIHARYALSILVETRERFGDQVPLLFRATADRVCAHEETADHDREYVDSIRASLSL